MTEIEFLNNEARIASAFAPEGAKLAVVASSRSSRYDCPCRQERRSAASNALGGPCLYHGCRRGLYDYEIFLRGNVIFNK